MKFAWLNCTTPNVANLNSKRIDDLQPNLVAFIGDTPYMAYSDLLWRMPVSHTDTDLAGPIPKETSGPVPEARFRMNHDAYKANPAVARLDGKYDTRWMVDNHEIASGWSHRPVNAQHNDAGMMSQFDTNETYFNARDAMIAAHPQMTLIYESGLGDVPSEAHAGAPGNDTDANYFPTWGSEIQGNVEIFYLDCMAGKDPYYIKAYNDVTKLMIGTKQRAWLDAGLVRAKNDAAIDFILIVTAKAPFTDTPGASQGWDSYQIQLRSIIDTYTAAGVTGVLWCAGDVHHPVSHSDVVAWAGVAFAGVTASPGAQVNGGSDFGAVTPPDIGTNVYVKRNVDAIQTHCFGFVEVNGSTLNAKIIDQFGDVLFSGDMIPTSNSWQ